MAEQTALAMPSVQRAPPPGAARLPTIRDELRVSAASTNHDGTPAWVIHDPVRNRFFRIGWLHFEMMLNWQVGGVQTLVDAIASQTALHPTAEDVMEFIKFLSDNELLRLDRSDDVKRVHALHARSKQTGWRWLLHHYLFFRVPLLRPQRWLAMSEPHLAWVQTKTTAVVVLTLTLLGLFLVSRQWDTFTHTLLDQMTFSGVVGYASALVVAKALHELGHAFAATRLGVRVAHMGVAFLVMAPMLYTDTSESWRLKKPSQRRYIASAGMAVELALAGLATLAWALTPDSPVRNGLFFLATTSWVLTLIVNASPFMRFDGYFILSDILDIPNLHERSGALARVWLRRTLLGWKQDWPEDFSTHARRALIAFGVTTWLYRLSVFLGIAFLVYSYFFKVLGLFLMGVELVWFIGKPILRELKVWKTNQAHIVNSRKWAGALLLIALLLFLFLPLSTSVRGYGWLRAEEQQAIFSPIDAQVVAMPSRQKFRQGDVVMTLDSPILGFEQERAQQLAMARENELQGLMGLPNGEHQRNALSSQKQMYEAEAQASIEQKGRLMLRAPFDGELRDLDPEIEPNSWVGSRHALAWLVNPHRWVVDAYVPEVDLARIRKGQTVRVRQMVEPAVWLSGHVAEVDFTRTTVLPSPILDARHGGPLAVINSKDRHQSEPVLRDALFRVRVELDSMPEQARISIAKVQIQGGSESIAGQLLRSAVSVIVRESGA